MLSEYLFIIFVYKFRRRGMEFPRSESPILRQIFNDFLHNVHENFVTGGWVNFVIL